MEQEQKVFDIIEQAKREIQKNQKAEQKIINVVKRPFNKSKAFLICCMCLMFFMLVVAYIFIALMLSGYGNGIKWATDIAKETSRSTITTGLHIIDLMIGFVVGRQLGKNENKKNDMLDE